MPGRASRGRRSGLPPGARCGERAVAGAPPGAAESRCTRLTGPARRCIDMHADDSRALLRIITAPTLPERRRASTRIATQSRAPAATRPLPTERPSSLSPRSHEPHDDDPPVRHHAPRRHPARGALALGRGQAQDRPRARPAGRELHRGRMARARTPRTPSSSAGSARCRSRTRGSRPSAAPAAPASRCEDDANLRALLDAETPVVTMVGKSSTLHVDRVLETTRDENLRMIGESVAFLKRPGREVIYDAEHFFDGYDLDPEYALDTLAAAAAAGADCLVLCDTNGGALPDVVRERVCDRPRPLRDCRSASTRTTTPGSPWPTRLAAVRAGLRAGAGHRSTATASAAATSTSSRSSPRCSSSSEFRCSTADAAAHGSPRSRSSSPRWPTSIPIPTRRTSGGARSRTRAASTSPPSRRCPRAISTSIPRRSATRCAWS